MHESLSWCLGAPNWSDGNEIGAHVVQSLSQICSNSVSRHGFLTIYHGIREY